MHNILAFDTIKYHDADPELLAFIRAPFRWLTEVSFSGVNFNFTQQFGLWKFHAATKISEGLQSLSTKSFGDQPYHIATIEGTVEVIFHALVEM
jgi:hypothetical protein